MELIKEKAKFIKPELGVEELSVALYQANQKLERVNKELVHSHKELTEIFVNISHDLRSPITAIRNSVDYLLSSDDPCTEEGSIIMRQVFGRVEYLEKLINDVFLLSTIDSRAKTFQYESVNIGMFLEEFYFSCEADTKYSERKLILEVPEVFPYLVSIDCKMMQRVLDNLFTNAYKYSMDGSEIILSASCIQNSTILISVEDYGIGIAQEHLEEVFKRTYKVSSARTPDQVTGCGLGLTIAKSIIESHDGDIWCESVPGKGSVFKITLPLKRKEIATGSGCH